MKLRVVVVCCYGLVVFLYFRLDYCVVEFEFVILNYCYIYLCCCCCVLHTYVLGFTFSAGWFGYVLDVDLGDCGLCLNWLFMLDVDFCLAGCV